MIISIDAEKFDKVQHYINKMENSGYSLNKRKYICLPIKPVLLSGQALEDFLLKWQAR